MTERTYDVTIWGATGFTGELVAEYFSRVVSVRHPDLRWCVAGRNEKKLTAVVASLSTKPGIVVASITDKASVDRLVSQTRVLISTAGPFVNFGTPIVEACVRHGTHYTDITGETPWVHGMIAKFHESAKRNGTFIVPMCGFDSIPSDLGAFFTAKHVREKFDKPCRRVTGYFMSNGGPSGGTLASGQNMQSHPELQDLFTRPFLLGGGAGKGVRPEDEDVREAVFNEELGTWTAPFGMAGINTRVVRRSSWLLEGGEGGKPAGVYAPDFGYNEMTVAPNEKIARKIANPPSPAVIKKLIAAGRLPKPGSGPSPATRAAGWFGVFFVGVTADGDTLVTSLKGGDPGYTETSKMVSEAALSLLFGQTAPGRAGGVITPAVAFGDALIDNLKKVQLELKVEQVGKPSSKDVLKTVSSFVRAKPSL